MSRLVDVALPAALGAAGTTVATAVLESRPPGGRERWERTNYAGRVVSLLGGAAVGAGAATAALATAVTATTARSAPTAITGAVTAPGAGRAAVAGAVAAGAGAAMGLVDDLREDTAEPAKGLRGHLGALARGRVTTGALKIAGIGAGALVASWLVTPRQGPAVVRAGEVLTGAALVAATANLHNLFDLRPGRSLKVATLVSAPLAVGAPRTAGGTLAATALGVAGAALADDLNEVTMLGDTGANALGGLVGAALAAQPSRVVRGGALVAAVGLTLLSERVSFSRVIERTGPLRRLDALGRRTR
jgi:UDP-N-acetylmuramyl pentapeptide phosphotransferase/UDP-N-acetylglucosamine-1-phosphate transferase